MVRDFSLRNIGGYFAGFLVISAFSVCIGLFLEGLPDFWRGILVGSGLALMGAFLGQGARSRKPDVSTLPQPSPEVKATCDDPDGSLFEAVKAYRLETGLGLFEAKAVLDSYIAGKRLREPEDALT